MTDDHQPTNDESGAPLEPPWMTPHPAQRLEGTERFVGLDATVREFWGWAFSDLRDNVTRGILAELLVAKAVADDRGIRVAWDNFDVLALEGTTIEVKCSAFLQSWPQRTHSRIAFDRLRARSWDPSTNQFSVEEQVRADVFVFAVQTQLEPDQYDMLDLAHWQFWVVSGAVIREQRRKSVGISWVKRHAAGPIAYHDLAHAIRTAANQTSNTT